MGSGLGVSRGGRETEKGVMGKDNKKEKEEQEVETKVCQVRSGVGRRSRKEEKDGGEGVKEEKEEGLLFFMPYYLLREHGE